MIPGGTMKSSFIKLFLLLVLLLSVSCNLSNSNSGGNPESQDPTDQTDPTDPIDDTEEQLSMLENLGIDTSIGGPSDPNGNPLPSGYHPLGESIGSFAEKAEIFLAGNERSGYYNTLYDDGSQGYAALRQASEGNFNWQNYPKKALAADVDGDGVDEIMVLLADLSTGNIEFILLDHNGSYDGGLSRKSFPVANLQGELTGTANSGSSNTWENYYARFDAASGNVDNDPREELILIIGHQLWIFDDNAANFTQLVSYTATDHDPGSTTFLRGELGDIDLDGRDEIWLANGEGNTNITAQYLIFDDLVENPAMSSPLYSGALRSGSGDYVLSAADLAVGDFDADGLVEAAFAGRGGVGNNNYSSSHVTLVLDVSMNFSSQLEVAMAPNGQADDYTDGAKYAISGVVSVALLGGKQDFIATYNDIYRLASDGGQLEHTPWWGNEAISGLGVNFSTDNYPWLDLIASGDVTGDGREDIVYLTWDEDQLYIISSNDQGSLVLKDNFYVNSGQNGSFALCLPNVDADSPVLKYHDHELLFTDPIVLQVLASPPYYAGINQTGTGSTSFSFSEGTSSTTGSSHGLSVGYTLGAGFDALLVEAEVKTTVENSFSWGTSITNEIVETTQFTTSLGQDMVVFTAIPFDVYYYEVLSSADASQVGDIVTINVPRTPRSYSQTVDLFNSHCKTMQINDAVLKHQLGDPLSYATLSDRNALMDIGKGMFSQQGVSVGQGNSGNTNSIEMTAANTSTFEYGLSVSLESEIQAGGIIAGNSVGYQYGFEYSQSILNGTAISGTVPNLPVDAEGQLVFQWGIMAYPVVHQGQEFTVVSYWVDP